MNIFKRIGLIALSVCLAFGSLFITMPQKSNKYANADNTSYSNVTFYSSDILNNYTPWYTNQYYDYRAGGTDSEWSIDLAQTSLLYSFCINHQPTSQESNNLIFMGLRARFNNSYYLDRSAIESKTGVSNAMYSGDTADYWGVVFDTSVIQSDSYFANVSYRYYVNNVIKYTVIGIAFSSATATAPAPSMKMVSVEIGSSIDAQNNGFAPYYFTDSEGVVLESYQSANIIKYTDTHGFCYYYYLPCYATESSGVSLFYSYRKYLLSGAFDFSDNSYYQQGLSDGYNNGYSQGESIGYQNGSESGYQQGFQAGRVDGIESANQYTFLGLIGAVVDAPVSVFKSMFNFNLLGVNLRDFFLALLTACGLIVIVKFALAK